LNGKLEITEEPQLH